MCCFKGNYSCDFLPCNIFKLAYSKDHGVLFDSDFQTPLILDESLDFSDPDTSRFAGELSDGLLAKSEPILSMSTFQKPPQAALLDYGATRSVHDDAAAAAAYSYGTASYVTTPMMPSPLGADQGSQLSDCVPYLANGDYASSYGDAASPGLAADGNNNTNNNNHNNNQTPEVVSYSPQRGNEGTKVFVQIQSPYDLHSTSGVSLSLIFGSKRCECIPHLLDIQDSSFQYAISADAPLFMSTGSQSFAVPLQVSIDSQTSTTLQVGVYTYEQVSSSSSPASPADTSSRKRRISSFDDEAVSQGVKRYAASSAATQQQQDGNGGYGYRETRSASFSPYMQNIPAVNGFVNPYRPGSSPRMGGAGAGAGPGGAATGHYSAVSTASQQPSSLRAPSPLMSSWNPSSYMSMASTSDIRNPALAVSHTLRGGPKPPSPATSSNPTLIRTSTLNQSSGFGQTQSFNPYTIYPSKAVLKLNGDLDSMVQGWNRDEQECKRRLVQFTRVQNGSTIHADFGPVAPEKRAPNSICISCIYWDGKDECFVTSVDTIYLLESLVGVRFTVEEKNRIRRNLEGFRPLTVSKAKADSEDFFKIIMGFPAPKPRNIEKDVKVFPWKILSHALKKIIGKYSASYSSTASTLPAPIGSNYGSSYISYGTGSDSGTDTQNAGSPQSVSDTAASTYGTSMATSNYSPPTESCIPPLTGGSSDFRTVMPAASQPFTSLPAQYSYSPAAAAAAAAAAAGQYGLSAPVNKSSWEFNGLINTPSAVGTAPSNGCYNYVPPMPYQLTDTPNGA